MYPNRTFNNRGLGDVGVVYHDGLYHLFHLVLPNHTFIAHAVSRDGLTWHRIRNALWVSDPGAWDDDMLWTMHVSADPHQAGLWRMFYTGLTRRDGGRNQRIGLAISTDLTHWKKVTTAPFPLELTDPRYEQPGDGDRPWWSFRDPFFTTVAGESWLLAAGRVSHGESFRRGCVAKLVEQDDGQFETCAPLHWPGRYDDIEVPSLTRIGDHYYLIGSTQEDVKVHYWHADHPQGPYHTFEDNVLLPRGNYAARVSSAGDDRHLLWCFLATSSTRMSGVAHTLPPPKELVAQSDGQLRLRPFRGLDALVTGQRDARDLVPEPTVKEADVELEPDGALRIGWPRGFCRYLLPAPPDDFRLHARLDVTRDGKYGLLLRADHDGSGYVISLDLSKGLAQVRAWGHTQNPLSLSTYRYRQLQTAYFLTPPDRLVDVTLLALGPYLELAIDGWVELSLADDRYTTGAVGFYTEGAELTLTHLRLEELQRPAGEVFDPFDVHRERGGHERKGDRDERTLREH